MVEQRLPEAVSDPAVPAITSAYRSGDAIGKARAWYDASPPHDVESTGDATLEVWFQPDNLTSGQQVIVEFGGSGFGSYLGLIDDELHFFAKGSNTALVSHTLTAAE